MSVSSDILFEIMMYLPASTILHMCSTSKEVNRMCKSPHIWKKLYSVKFPYSTYVPSDRDWKKTYMRELDRQKRIREEIWDIVPGTILSNSTLEMLYALSYLCGDNDVLLPIDLKGVLISEGITLQHNLYTHILALCPKVLSYMKGNVSSSTFDRISGILETLANQKDNADYKQVIDAISSKEDDISNIYWISSDSTITSTIDTDILDAVVIKYMKDYTVDNELPDDIEDVLITLSYVIYDILFRSS